MSGNPKTRDTRPLYARALRLKHIRPGSLLCFLYFEGSVFAGLVLVFAELAPWWVAIVLPVAVAVMVKVNDLIAGATVAEPSVVLADEADADDTDGDITVDGIDHDGIDDDDIADDGIADDGIDDGVGDDAVDDSGLSEDAGDDGHSDGGSSDGGSEDGGGREDLPGYRTGHVDASDRQVRVGSVDDVGTAGADVGGGAIGEVDASDRDLSEHAPRAHGGPDRRDHDLGEHVTGDARHDADAGLVTTPVSASAAGGSAQTADVAADDEPDGYDISDGYDGDGYDVDGYDIAGMVPDDDEESEPAMSDDTQVIVVPRQPESVPAERAGASEAQHSSGAGYGIGHAPLPPRDPAQPGTAADKATGDKSMADKTTGDKVVAVASAPAALASDALATDVPVTPAGRPSVIDSETMPLPTVEPTGADVSASTPRPVGDGQRDR